MVALAATPSSTHPPPEARGLELPQVGGSELSWIGVMTEIDLPQKTPPHKKILKSKTRPLRNGISALCGNTVDWKHDGVSWGCGKKMRVTVLPGESQGSLLAALCTGDSSARISWAQCLGMASWAPEPQNPRTPGFQG